LDVVPVAGGFVAVLVDVDVLLVVGGGVCVVVWVIVVVAVEVVEVVVVVDELAVVGVLEQWFATSSLTVSAPWPRFWISVVLTLRGSCPMRFENRCAATAACAHRPARTAEEIAASWVWSALAWPPESRPLLPPQATTNAAAKPRLAARSARAPWRIRRLTLEAVPVCLKLEAAG
jgi:hypothetical protein